MIISKSASIYTNDEAGYDLISIAKVFDHLIESGVEKIKISSSSYMGGAQLHISYEEEID